VAVVAQLLAHYGHGDEHMSWGGGWWMVIWGTVMMVGLVVIIVWLVRSATMGTRTRHDLPSGDPLESARQILADRYARGELTSEEYRERVDHLR